MSPRISRRTLLLGVASTSALASVAKAATAAAAPTALPPVPLFIRAVSTDQGPVIENAKIDEALSHASAIFGEHGISFVEPRERERVAQKFADVVTRADRDAFAGLLVAGAVNVFVVRKLEDVDEPGRIRMGVAWRCRHDAEKRYVIVAAYARPRVMAHELGHFLGNPHSSVKNNLMSYAHEEGARVFLDAEQAKVARAAARSLFAARADRSGSAK